MQSLSNLSKTSHEIMIFFVGGVGWGVGGREGGAGDPLTTKGKVGVFVEWGSTDAPLTALDIDTTAIAG